MGLARNANAPLPSGIADSSVEITQTGMCRNDTSFLMRQLFDSWRADRTRSRRTPLAEPTTKFAPIYYCGRDQ